MCEKERRLFTLIQRKFGHTRDWYRIHDGKKTIGAHPISPQEAAHWNGQGFGIFHTVNSFRGPRRSKNLKRINCWTIDIDEGSKDEQLQRIETCPLYPSLVVETKNGHHVYWNAIDATEERFEEIVADRLIPYFKADKKAKDLARLLRVPGFTHWKDENDPFEVKIVYWNDCAYREEDMVYAFRLRREQEAVVQAKTELRKVFSSEYESDDIWEKVYRMDCKAALERLSGTGYVYHEEYKFKRVGNGNFNILVNGKSSSCWIDRNGRIGSMDGGGPTIFSWLKWYGRSNSDVLGIIKAVFPEMFGYGCPAKVVNI